MKRVDIFCLMKQRRIPKQYQSDYSDLFRLNAMKNKHKNINVEAVNPKALRKAHKHVSQYLNRKWADKQNLKVCAKKIESQIFKRKKWIAFINMRKALKPKIHDCDIFIYKSKHFIETHLNVHISIEKHMELRQLYKFCFLAPYVLNISMQAVRDDHIKFIKTLRNDIVNKALIINPEQFVIQSSFDIYNLHQYIPKQIIVEYINHGSFRDPLISSYTAEYYIRNRDSLKNKLIGASRRDLNRQLIEIDSNVYEPEDSLNDIRAIDKMLKVKSGISNMYRETHRGHPLLKESTYNTYNVNGEAFRQSLERRMYKNPKKYIKENCNKMDYKTNETNNPYRESLRSQNNIFNSLAMNCHHSSVRNRPRELRTPVVNIDTYRRNKSNRHLLLNLPAINEPLDTRRTINESNLNTFRDNKVELNSEKHKRRSKMKLLQKPDINKLYTNRQAVIARGSYNPSIKEYMYNKIRDSSSTRKF